MREEDRLETGLFSNANFKREEEEGGGKYDEKEEVSLCPDCNNPLDIRQVQKTGGGNGRL